jgi:hypothetical protein
MLGWKLYMKRRSIDPRDFLKGCSSIEQAKQRFESKKIKAPDDETIAQYLESMSNAAPSPNADQVPAEIEAAPSKELILVPIPVDYLAVPEEPAIVAEIDSPPKRRKSRKKKQATDSDESTEEEDARE